VSTGIPYLDEHWSVTTGCWPEFACWAHCWARGMAKRFAGGDFKPTFHHERLHDPLHWRKPRRIGVSFCGDLFVGGITDEEIAAVFNVMATTPRHQFLVLTKRSMRMVEWYRWVERLRGQVARGGNRMPHLFRPTPWPLGNVWAGVSVSTRADLLRLHHLRHVAARVRWVSAEPLLEDLGEIDLIGIDWLVVGAESTPGARPADIAWVRSLRDQALAAGVAFYHKQGPGDPGEPFHAPRLDGVVHAAMPGVRL